MESSTDTPDWSKIPAPPDDGAARHLPGQLMASVPLSSTDGRVIDLSVHPGRVVVYAYPRTGLPGIAHPESWDLIPGARGCTPQSCSFRDRFKELQSLGITAVYGLSTQDTAYQREAVDRLHLPFAILSDQNLALTKAMKFPTFDVTGMTLLKRFTLILNNGRVEHVFYPVFPPDTNAGAVVTWLSINQRCRNRV